MDIFGNILIALIVVAVPALLCTLVGFDVVEYFRRAKYPKWYEHFDRATKNSFSIGSRLKDEADIINKCIAYMQEAYRKGELTADEFRGVMKVYTDDYIKAVYQFKQDTVALEIEEDLRAADKYAKENNFKYGILYEDNE